MLGFCARIGDTFVTLVFRDVELTYAHHLILWYAELDPNTRCIMCRYVTLRYVTLCFVELCCVYDELRG